MSVKIKRGFASMSRKAQRAIAVLGGKALARKRGRKYMAAIGRVGGMAKGDYTRYWANSYRSN